MEDRKKKDLKTELDEEYQKLHLREDREGFHLRIMELFRKYGKYAAESLVLDEIMNRMDINVYVTDPQTDHILYMNQKMKDAYGLRNPEEEICWRVLQEDMTGRCPFCPIPELLQNRDSHQQIVWEERSAKTGRVYENADSLITWLDGSEVHLQQSMDITDVLTLNRQANLDELCGIMNRWAGKKCLEKTLNSVQAGNETAVVGLLDINDLKVINDRLGHARGDRALVHATKLVKEQLGKDEYMFRLGGDEFICVLLNRTEKEVEAVLKRCSEDCPDFLKRAGIGCPQIFSYGHCAVSSSDLETVSDIIAKADKKMYQNKLRYHKNKLEEGVPLFGEEKKAFGFDSSLLYDALIRSTEDYIYVCNMKTGTFRYSPLLVRDLGFPSDMIIRPLPYWKDIVHPDDWERFYQSNMEIGEDKTDYHSVDFRVRLVNGECQWLRCRGYLMRDPYNQPSIFAGFMFKLDRENKIDSVTSLHTIHEFTKKFEQFLREHYNESIGMMVLDLDGFKNINSLYDHEFGDKLLKKCGEAIQSALPEGASLYRLDGDRFSILVEYPEEKEVFRLFERIQSGLSRLQVQEQDAVRVTASAGYATYPKDANSYLDTLKYCDFALQCSKEGGKNRITVFDQKILRQESRTARLLYELQDSVLHDFRGFSIVYQPQVNAGSGRIQGAEALLRWKCQELGTVPPSEFIPILENNRLINAAGKWVLRNALELLKDLIQYDETFTMSVNVSYIQLLDMDHVEELLTIIRESGIPAGNIMLELTESYLVSSMERMTRIFSMMREQGLRVAMDDFGSGYSSLALLKNAPFDLVKIDRGFVIGILESKFNQSFISCIVKICHDVDIQVCLEGVETEQEYTIVRNMELDLIQGYLFGKPQAAEELIQSLREGEQ